MPTFPVDLKFEREQRYIVLKLTDIEGVGSSTKQAIEWVCNEVAANRASQGKAPLECVVIESDWDCHQPAWELVESELSRRSAQAPSKLPDSNGQCKCVESWLFDEAVELIKKWNVERKNAGLQEATEGSLLDGVSSLLSMIDSPCAAKANPRKKQRNAER